MLELFVENLPTLIALIITGVFAGLLAGLLGVGGGIVIVPVLFFLFQSFGVSPESAITIATATSLATIIPTSISSIRAHHKKGNVDFALFKRWVPFILVGVIAGSWLVTIVDGKWLSGLFGVIAILAAINILSRNGVSSIRDTLPGTSGQFGMASSIGFFSSMVGIGGGTLSIPMLTACSYPVHRAVGTAAAIGFIISLPGALMLLVVGTTPQDAPVGTIGLVNLIGFLCIVPMTVLFAPVGASLGNKLNPEKLKSVFAVLLVITGARMIAQLLI